MRAVKPDWDDLGETYENSKKVLIGDVDCTVEGNKKLCEDHGIKGYPTIKYYNPGDRDGEVYEGERDLATLKKFVKTLGPPCGPRHLSKCTDEQKEQLLGYLATPLAELQEKADGLQQELAETESAHNELLKGLQAQYEESNKKLEAVKQANAPQIKMLKVAIANLTVPDAAAAVDEKPKEEL